MTPIWALFSFYDGMSSGQEPPPVTETRYGPALSERDRLRWFSDRRTPFERYAVKSKKEREQRMALGIIPDERPITKRPLSKKAEGEEFETSEESKSKDVEMESFLKFLDGIPDQ